jgi:hypothetical protein
MACALGTPSVIVSAGQHPGVYAPYSKNGLQTWLLPPPNTPKGEWRKNRHTTTIADSVRRVLSAEEGDCSSSAKGPLAFTSDNPARGTSEAND